MPAFGNSTADLENDVAKSDAHRHLDQPGISDSAGQGEYLGAFAALRSDARKPRTTPANDGRDIRESFDVIDQRGMAPQARLGRIRRPRPRSTALAFDGRHQRGFFATHKGPRSQADRNAEIELGPANPVAQQLLALRQADGCLEPRYCQRVFGSNIDIAFTRTHRVGRNGHALQHPVRIAFQHGAIHECARIAFVGVAHHHLG